MQSEKYYYEHHQAYYDNSIRALGSEYDMLDYSKGMEFLLMLPEGLVGGKK